LLLISLPGAGLPIFHKSVAPVPGGEYVTMNCKPEELSAGVSKDNQERQHTFWTPAHWGASAALLTVLVLGLVGAAAFVAPPGYFREWVGNPPTTAWGSPTSSAVPIGDQQREPIAAAVHHAAIVVRNVLWAGVALAFFGLLCRMVGCWLASGDFMVFNYHRLSQEARERFEQPPAGRANVPATGGLVVAEPEPEVNVDEPVWHRFPAPPAMGSPSKHGGVGSPGHAASSERAKRHRHVKK
jgi:hypothetical protein